MAGIDASYQWRRSTPSEYLRCDILGEFLSCNSEEWEYIIYSSEGCRLKGNIWSMLVPVYIPPC